MPLFERWQTTVQQHAAEVAMRDSGRVWTFRGLDEALASMAPATGPVQLRGRSVAFVLGTLRAWRDGQIAVPLEDGAVFDPVSGRLSMAPPECVHVKTTSGSTGAPRHILFTEEQLAADADQIVSTMGLRPDWPNVGVISLAHSYGFSNLVLPLLLHGIPLILAPDPLPESIRQIQADLKGVTIPAVPAMWRSWHTAGLLDQRIKIAISAGAPLPPDLERAAFEASGVKIHNFLGASECGGIAYDRGLLPREAETGYAGSAMDALQLGVDETGALRVISPAAGLTYWPDWDQSLAHGIFQSRDLVRLHNDEVYLLGRADDVINLSGRKVHPSEIEQALNSVPGVRHCVVFGVPSPRAGHTDDIAVGINLDAGIELTAVRRALAKTLPPWKQPRQWRLLPDLAPDARGKISRTQWKARFLTDAP